MVDLFGVPWLDSPSSQTVRLTRASGEARRNYEASERLGLPKFHNMNQLQWAPETNPVAIVGGGPSLLESHGDLVDFGGSMMACGTAHGYMIKRKWWPRYAVVYDADPHEAKFFKPIYPFCCYLVASHCHPDVFRTLLEQQAIIRVWHAAGDLPQDATDEPMVGGGSMVALRAIPLAVMLGYTDLHLFGVDSSFANGREYAYDHADWGDPMRPNPTIMRRVGSRIFATDRAFSLQADQLMQMLDKHGDKFKVTVHGDSLTAEMLMQRNYQRPVAE